MPLSIFRLCLALAAAAALAACEAPQPQVSRPGAPVVQAEAMSGRLSPREAASNFVSVAETMRPRIAQECAERTHGQPQVFGHHGSDKRISLVTVKCRNQHDGGGDNSEGATYLVRQECAGHRIEYAKECQRLLEIRACER